MPRQRFSEILSTKWLGAAFFWLLSGFKGKYTGQLQAAYDQRNIWAGYFIELTAGGIIVCIIYRNGKL